jgi:hypothetical protein
MIETKTSAELLGFIVLFFQIQLSVTKSRRSKIAGIGSCLSAVKMNLTAW